VQTAGAQSRADRRGTPDRRSEHVCPDFHAAIELVGRRWAGAILWTLSERSGYFAELGASVPGISDRLLSRRLRELEAAGLVARSVEEGNPPRVLYALTDKGRALQPALAALGEWARSWKLSS
jgi:DNA-binding HxlR family transcriptional regulator